MDIQEAYRTLEIPFGASEEEIKSAYQKLVRVWHPDRFANSPDLHKDANEKMKAINEAYQVLLSQADANAGRGESKQEDIELYRDAQVKYLGGDPRLRRISLLEFGGRKVGVEVSAEGVTLLTSSGGKVDEVMS